MFDYFELKDKTLLTVSDEITEAAHSALRTFEKIWVNFKSYYLNKTKFQLQQFQ